MKLDYVFTDEKLLETALTHSSYAHERGAGEFNERLEFLGDAVLELVISEYLYQRYKNDSEGSLTRMRASLVCEASLAALARKMRLDAELRLGRGEEQSGGRRRNSILSDAFEALLGAVFLDGGLDAARKFALGVFGDDIDGAKETVTDCKTYLQEVLQSEGRSAAYVIIDETGPDHAKTFTAAVDIDGKRVGQGVGPTKKEAEQKAALAALQEMGERMF